jgi:UDP-N-acetylmuramoyl-tripeptide--D-alanyl-D-alanine ligase
VAVLNADDPRVRAMAARTAARVVLVSTAPDAAPEVAVRAERISLDAAGRPAFTLVTPAGAAPVTLRLHGAHQVGNALAVAAVGLELGLDPAALAAALSDAGPVSRHRMEVSRRADGVTVVDDSYNANPDSMRAALAALTAMTGAGRSWAVLGHMAELGAASVAEHAAIGRHVAELGVDRLVVVGPAAAPLAAGAAGAGIEISTVPDPDAAAALLAAELRAGDVVLVKASRSAALERVAAAVLALVPVGPPTGGGGPT